MQVSKCFRCTIPGLRDDQLNNLRLWAERRCAQSALFRDEQGIVVFVALKDEFRTSASFARTVRTALRRMATVVPLRGRWCTLVSPREVLALCGDAAVSGQRCTDADLSTRRADPAEGDAGDDVRVVALR